MCTHAPPACAPLNPPCLHRSSRIFCEASFFPGSAHQRGYPTVLAEFSWCSLALGTHAGTHSLAHGPCLFSCLLIFGKLNKHGELAGDNQLGWGCRDENRVSGVPKSPPMCLKRIKRTLDPGYQRVQKDQEELKLMVCQKPPATEGHYFPSLKQPQFWGLIWSLIEMFQTVDYNEDETSPVHFMTFAKKGRLVIR